MDGSNVESSNSEMTFLFPCDQCRENQSYQISKEEYLCASCEKPIPRKLAIGNFLKEHFATQFDFPMESMSDDTVLREVGDSLGIIELLLRLEKKFGVAINHEDLEDLETIHDVAEYLDRMLKKSASN